jgi:hypothetical protein
MRGASVVQVAGLARVGGGGGSGEKKGGHGSPIRPPATHKHKKEQRCHFMIR